MDKVLLKVLGITYSQTQSGSYALILGEAEGNRRIPIIIGNYEAQAIAVQLEGLQLPRPLTHDLFFAFSVGFNVMLEEVFIYKLDEGFFYAKLVCDNGIHHEEFDARTSDAIALALRFQCPIFTTEEILERAGVAVNGDAAPPAATQRSADTLNNRKTADLEALLQESIEKEDYERASLIRDELNRRKTK